VFRDFAQGFGEMRAQTASGSVQLSPGESSEPPGGESGPLEAGADEPLLDLVHLERQCQRDLEFQREVLSLFRIQADAIMHRLASATHSPETVAVAHQLRGSALAIGAQRVARSAALLEGLATRGAPAAIAEAVSALRVDVGDALAAIGRLNLEHSD
jgi:HPt (histidine-containing phosphotransfer) domain-containing protein